MRNIVLQRLNAPSGVEVVLSESDYRQLTQKYGVFLQEYARHLQTPCIAVFEYNFEYNPKYPMEELVWFRDLARLEEWLMRYELQQGREQQAVQRFVRLLQFSSQISQDGTLIHHLVGTAIRAQARAPLLAHQVHHPQSLRTVLQAVQQFESNRIPLMKAFEHERLLAEANYYRLHRATWREFKAVFNLQDESFLTVLRMRLSLRPAYREFQTLAEKPLNELRKPLWERDVSALPLPQHPLNSEHIWFKDNSWINREAEDVAHLRLLGVLCAVRLHKHRTGNYPRTLDELGLGEMVIDPYTGKPFVYRVDPLKGFQLYSVGSNRVDDGGRILKRRHFNQDLGDIAPYISGPGISSEPLSAPVWFR